MSGIFAQPSFVEFWHELENGPHAAVHGSISGDMISMCSPNDPIFFLHHAQVDRLWWLWQQADLEVRGMEYESGLDWMPPVGLDDRLQMKGLAKDVRVRDVMSTTAGGLCYGY